MVELIQTAYTFANLFPGYYFLNALLCLKVKSIHFQTKHNPNFSFCQNILAYSFFTHNLFYTLTRVKVLCRFISRKYFLNEELLVTNFKNSLNEHCCFYFESTHLVFRFSFVCVVRLAWGGSADWLPDVRPRKQLQRQVGVCLRGHFSISAICTVAIPQVFVCVRVIIVHLYWKVQHTSYRNEERLNPF